MISSPIDEIKNRLDIAEVIQSYIKLQKAGANFKALCPFHSEKSPSFFISPARQIWHCFGCSAGGDIFKFVMQIEGVEFGDALRILAQRAGVELKKQDPKLKTERQRLYEICEFACLFFEKQLKSSKAGQIAKAYLLKRGLNEDSIKKWRLGYAPGSWQGLSDFLLNKGYQKEEIVKSGAVIKKERTDQGLRDYYDRFRERIIFPVFDLNSQVIGFAGRIFKAESEKTDNRKDVVEAKYMNTPATLLYDKSQILYGLDKARVEVRKKKFCVLVEGYIDVILSHQADFENIVATSGTALTPYQLKILKRYSDNLSTAFDMDIAGDAATKRGIDLAQARGFNIKVIAMEDGSDPADIISKDPKSWEKLILESKSILEFYFDTAFSKFNKKNPEGKKEISNILLPVIKIIPNKIEQSHWITELAKNLEVKEEVISEELKRASSQSNVEILDVDNGLNRGEKKTRLEMLEEKILTLVLKSPNALNLINKDSFGFFTNKGKEILANLKDAPDFNLKGKISPESFNFFNYLFLKKDLEPDEIDSGREIQTCLKEIDSLQTKAQLDEISLEIKKAEEENKSQEVDLLIQKFNELSQKLREA